MSTNSNDKRREEMRINPRWKEEWPDFSAKFEARLRSGHRQYGDRSFERPLFSLLAETEEEIYDQILWSFIALTRITDLRKRIQKLEDKIGEAEIDLMLTELTEEGLA